MKKLKPDKEAPEIMKRGSTFNSKKGKEIIQNEIDGKSFTVLIGVLLLLTLAVYSPSTALARKPKRLKP